MASIFYFLKFHILKDLLAFFLAEFRELVPYKMNCNVTKKIINENLLVWTGILQAPSNKVKKKRFISFLCVCFSFL